MNRKQFDECSKPHVAVVSVLALLAAGVSGCADLVISDADLNRISASVEQAVTLSACDPLGDTVARNATIDIEFTKNSAGAWCPTGQVETCPQVFKSKKVQWRSVTRDDSGTWQPLKTRFKVYFTPFQGDAFTAPNGETGLKKIDENAPDGVYKYSVWDWPSGTEGHKCDPLDPNFRVNK